MGLRLDSGEKVDARIKGKRIRAVCGDTVMAEPIKNEKDWLITRIGARRNELTRPNMRGQVEVLAANVDTLIIVASVSPLPDWYIVDRYLCAAELMGVESIVVFNKIDLLEGHDIEIPELQEYRDIGLSVIECSAETEKGISELRRALAGKCNIVVGQSGVGKSSLINKLVIDSNQRTAQISSKSGEGRHTTVNSVMIPLIGVATSLIRQAYATTRLRCQSPAMRHRDFAKSPRPHSPAVSQIVVICANPGALSKMVLSRIRSATADMRVSNV